MSAPALTLRRLLSLDEVGQRAWDDLAGRSAGATFFQGWAWNAAWWSARSDPTHKLVLLAVMREERLVALAPLHLGSPNRKLGRAMSFVGQGNADYQDVLLDRDEPEALPMLVEAIASLDEPWQRLQLYELPEGSAFRRFLEDAERTDRIRLVRRSDTLCPRFDAAADPQGFARLAEKQSLKRHAARLAREGPVEIAHLYDAQAILDELPSFFRQHAERWAVTETPSLFLDPAARALYEQLVRLAAPRGEVVLSVVRVSGRPVAYHLGFVHDGRLIWYKPSFDLRLHRAAPGEVLLQATIRHVRERGLKELDMTRGDETYKARFSNGARRNANWIWFRDPGLERRFLVGRALRHALRRPLSLARGNAVFGGYVETFDDAWRARGAKNRSLRGALQEAGARVLRDVVERRRFASCRPRGPAAAGVAIREATLDAFLLGADLDPDSPRTAVVADAYRRIRRGERGLLLYRDDRPRAALWLDAGGRVVSARSLEGPLTSHDLGELLRAAASESGSKEGAIEVRIEPPLGRASLERSGVVVAGIETEWLWFAGKRKSTSEPRS